MITSNSAIQTFKSCRRLYELRYVYELTPVHVADTLDRGLRYHDIVEKILNRQEWTCDNPKITAMAKAFEKFVYPKIENDVASTEDWFTYHTPSGHEIVGRTDGLTKDGIPIEHKTTTGMIGSDYIARLGFDEQILTYMTAHRNPNALGGMGSIFYTICATPTLKQKKDEDNDDFEKRCFEWFGDGDISKITSFQVHHTEQTLDEFLEDQDKIVTEMENCKLFYRNPSHCTKWGRMCEYAPICMEYDPAKDYIEFTRKEHDYEKINKTGD